MDKIENIIKLLNEKELFFLYELHDEDTHVLALEGEDDFLMSAKELFILYNKIKKIKDKKDSHHKVITHAMTTARELKKDATDRLYKRKGVAKYFENASEILHEDNLGKKILPAWQGTDRFYLVGRRGLYKNMRDINLTDLVGSTLFDFQIGSWDSEKLFLYLSTSVGDYFIQYNYFDTYAEVCESDYVLNGKILEAYYFNTFLRIITDKGVLIVRLDNYYYGVNDLADRDLSGEKFLIIKGVKK